MKRNILIIGAAVLIIAVLVAMIHNLYQDMEKVVVEMFNRQQLFMARHAAEMIEDYFESLKRDLRILADSPEVQYLEKEGCFRKIKGIYDTSLEPAVVDIGVLDAEGILRFNILDPGLIGNDFSQRRYFQEARKLPHGEVFTSELLTLVGGEFAGRKGFILAITVFQNIKEEHRPDPSQKFNGLVVFPVLLERLIERFVAPIKSGRSGYAFLLNGHGTLLYHPEHPEMVGNNIFQRNESCYGCHQSFDLEEEMVQGKGGMGVYSVQIGRKKLIAFSPVRIGNELWSIGIETPYSEITHLVRDRKSTRLNSSHIPLSRMPSSA